MATLAKPKKEKKKKSQRETKELKQCSQNENDKLKNIFERDIREKFENEIELVNELEKLKLLGLDQLKGVPSTSKNGIHECSIAPKHKELDKDMKDKKVDTGLEIIREGIKSVTLAAVDNAENMSFEENIQVKEIISTESTVDLTLAPSAPPSEVIMGYSTTNVTRPITVMKYPNLLPMQMEEAKSRTVYKTIMEKSAGFSLNNTQLKPLTPEERRRIYYCTDIELVKQFELEFLMNSLLETAQDDPLFAALQIYFDLQSKLSSNIQDINSCKKEIEEMQEKIWVKVPISKTFHNKCGDGKDLREVVTYDVIQVDSKMLESTRTTLMRLFQLVCDRTANTFTAEVTKFMIDKMINELISYPGITCWTQDGNIRLNNTFDMERLECVSQLRRAISMLFTFIRRLSPNAKFDADVKVWLTKLISLHLLIASKEDHWFLLFNIIRCPSGIGSWATAYIQIPFSTNTQDNAVKFNTHEIQLELDSAEMNHCLTIMQILLLPIKKRNEYLKAFAQSHKDITDPAKEERWILIDSDGEDSHTKSGECAGLKESDLIALLNQIPFEKIFTSALGIEKFKDDYVIEADMISGERVLKVIGYFMKLIEIIGEGMLTYNTERYKQLAKRLARLITHTSQYISDYYELFINNKQSKSATLCERISVELHILILNACNYIYRTRNLSTWQYFSSLPFNTFETKAVWQMFYYLNVGFPIELSDINDNYAERFRAPDFWIKFNVANADSSPEDLYYLLQTFFEMANERDKIKDCHLIKTICLHIFYIGFINGPTRDECYKHSRDMLVNLILAYEDLLSALLLEIKLRFVEIENASYLLKSLPLENWKTDMDSFEIISNWLLHFDFNEHENILARIIISRLNWGFDCEGRLFLPHNIHVRMACLITDALTKHAPEVIGTSGISESVRQVSNLMDFTQSARDRFTSWCWSMVFILRLHLMDQSCESIKKTLSNPAEPLMFVPELERIDIIYQGVTESRPLAVFVAMLVSLDGHSIPLICQKGFALMKLLLDDYRHDAVIRCIELIVPLFIETPDILANCDSFQLILNLILDADKTYIKMAKDIMYPYSVGPVLELIDNMIHRQITTYTEYGLSTPLNLINVWLNCLTSLHNWPHTNAVYLLDKILRVAYQFPNSRLQAVEFFHNYYKDCDEWKGSNKMSAFKTFFTTNQSRIPSLSPQQSWLALVLLEIEFKIQDTHFWPEFIHQLAIGGLKSNVDNALKRTFSMMKISSFPPQMLVIYKYANLIAHMDIIHPIFPVMCQKFFELFLSRAPPHHAEQCMHVYGVSDKFYEYNLSLMKKIKSNLKAAATRYQNESIKYAQNDEMAHCYRDCARIMTTFTLWLEETSINTKSRDELSFPPQYNIEKLHDILNGNTQHWTEYIYLPKIRKEQRYQADQWAIKCYRLKSITHLRTPLQPKPKVSHMERIKTHLRSYDKSIEAPTFIRPHLRQINITSNSIREVRDQLKVISQTATKYHFMISELNSLNCNYLDIIQNLYHMVQYQEVKIRNCSSVMFARTCSNPTRIKVSLERICKNADVEEKLTENRARHKQLSEQMLEWNVANCVQSIEYMSSLAKVLVNAQMNEAACPDLVTTTGIHFFYGIIECMNDMTMKFTPTNDFCNLTLGELGVFLRANQETEGVHILELALKHPDLLEMLSGVVVPYHTRPEYFLKMYNFLIDSYLKRCDNKVLFVLFSKFDLKQWLEAFQPKLYHINELLKLVLCGLECWSQADSSLLQGQFRRHLLHIFHYDFPEHYGEVVQMVLDRISDNKLMPLVLLEMLNSLLERFNCDRVSMETSEIQTQEISIDFSRRQNLFNMKAVGLLWTLPLAIEIYLTYFQALDTVMLFARHFQKERLNHGLHGLYPKHKDYCKPLAMWFSCVGHVVVITAICSYQELLADQISELIFSSIIELYSPWLITYTETTMPRPAANWIRQLTVNGKMLYPWSEHHACTSKVMMRSFIDTLKYVLENLPVSHKILNHTFGWYLYHFALPDMQPHVYMPIHEGIAALPWERFRPQSICVDMLYESLQKFIPEAHAMLGHIFLRVGWTAWFEETLPVFPIVARTQIVSRLFTIFIKISFEPNIHIHTKTSAILEDAIGYAWHMVQYDELETLLKWFVNTVDPSIILRIPSDSNCVDHAVLELLRLACCMMPEKSSQWNFTLQPICNANSKRILYTRFIVRQMHACIIKNRKLLATKEGVQVFNQAFVALLNTIDNSQKALAPTKTLEEQKQETFNSMIEVLLPMQTQSEETTKLHVGAMIQWLQQQTSPNLLTYGILSAIGHMKTFVASTYTLLEATIATYFRTSDETKYSHTPSWNHLLHMLTMSYDKLELMPIIGGQHFFILHVYILYTFQHIQNLGEQVTFLQDISQLVEDIKISEQTESYIALVWGVLIARACSILSEMESARKPLLMLGRHLLRLSTEAEGWGNGILGAIGLKKTLFTNKRKVLTRSLACFIFSLLSETCTGMQQTKQEFTNALNDLTMLLANKRYADIKPLIAKAVDMIKNENITNLRDVPHFVCRLINVFYEDQFLTTIAEIWDFDYKLI